MDEKPTFMEVALGFIGFVTVTLAFGCLLGAVEFLNALAVVFSLFIALAAVVLLGSVLRMIFWFTQIVIRQLIKFWENFGT